MTAPSSRPAPPDDPEASAEDAGLRYVTDGTPGVTRRRAGNGWTFHGPDGRRITDAKRIAWFRRLAIPPAWTDVWICPDRRGHLQATGRDARGRKVYRYHPRWRASREEDKYARMVAFARALPAIRRRVDRDLRCRGLPREKVLAAVVALLERTRIRVGNEEYARDNRSFGLTTLQDRHARIRGGRMTFAFRGKSGKEHAVEIADRRLARIVARCQDLPGQQLFQYVDDDGERRTIASDDVNDYLREISGQAFTAKDFRTWAGTVLAAMALQEFRTFDTEAEAKRNVVRAIETVAEKLGNTPAVSRASYVHPQVIDAYLEGDLLRETRESADRTLRGELPNLTAEEAAVLALLRQRLSAEERRAARRRRGLTSLRPRRRAGPARAGTTRRRA
jgi:DNA topoisomerase-1